mmetsp:Transcript_2933/g.8715  ORF Transcript_2933/g.8715 Transcript_2933/m.8715 type:complete len:177 (-) Transcript_2933:60-590(-)
MFSAAAASDDRAVFLEGKKRVAVRLDAAGDALRISERPRSIVPRLGRSTSRTFALKRVDRVRGAGTRVSVAFSDGRSLDLDAPSDTTAAAWRRRLRAFAAPTLGRHRRRASFFLGGAPPSPDNSVRHDASDGEFSSASSLSDVDASPETSPVARKPRVRRPRGVPLRRARFRASSR